jgi:hypothetical protein
VPSNEVRISCGAIVLTPAETLRSPEELIDHSSNRQNLICDTHHAVGRFPAKLTLVATNMTVDLSGSRTV